MSPERHSAGIGTAVDVGVVVVTFNSADVIGGLLASVEAGLAGLRWRLVVVDNASSDDTVGIVRSAGFDVVAGDTNDGYAAALNVGTSLLPEAAAILVLNPDVELTPGAVRKMMDVLDNPRVGIVAPKMLLPDERSTLEPSQRRDPSLPQTWGTALLGSRVARRFAALGEAVIDPHAYETERDVDWAVGAVLLTARRCIDAIGEWDERFFLYSEEVDYCYRARQAGFVVRYTPRAVVRHKGGDGIVNPRLRSMMIVNKVRFYRRHHGAFPSWLFLMGNVVHELTRGVKRPGSRAAAVALISKSRRPPEIDASASLLPR